MDKTRLLQSLEQHAPTALSLLLFIAVAVNLTNVFALPLWFAALPALAAAAAIWWWRRAGAAVLLRGLMQLGVIALLAVALSLLLPAWQLIVDGASSSRAGRMAPLFAAALALYAAHIWFGTTLARARPAALERLLQLASGPSLAISLLVALVLCASFLLGLEWWGAARDDSITRRFLERGIIPPISVLLFFWGALLLFGKAWNTWILKRMPAQVDAAFGEGGDFEQSMTLLWRRLEESYLIPRYIVWAVPVLGFIGTVLGISLAADSIRRIISSDAGIAGLSGELGGAIAPLGIAFDTTLIALSLSVVLMLMLTLVQRSEEGALAALERLLRQQHALLG